MTNEPTALDNCGNIYDRILRNNINEYEVFYNVPSQGTLDKPLMDAIINKEKIKIYYRSNNRVKFTYLGETNIVDIIQYRQVPLEINATNHDTLQLHMVVKTIHNKIVPRNNFKGSDEFKKDVLVHSGLINTTGENMIQYYENTGLYYY
jgi:hypothetical protein